MAARLRIATVVGGVVLAVLALLLLLPATALAQGPRITTGSGTIDIGPRILGEPAFAFELDALSQDEVSRPGWPVTTTRSTPVPCEVAPGQWEMVPANTACVGRWGLESWAATTSYLSYGAELDRWSTSGGGTVTKVAQGYRLSGPVGSSVVQTVGNATEQTTYTFACILRGEGQARLEFGGSQVMSMSPEWRQYSRTASISAGGLIEPRVYTGDGSSTSDPVDIMGCWLTRTSTPGRPCWGGEAPVTCAADQHTVSTEGWPTESGSMRFVVTLLGDAPDHRAVFDGGADATLRMAIQTNGAIRLSWDGLNLTTPALAWEYDRPYVFELRFNGLTVSMYRDGVFLRDFTYSRPVEWAPVARLGTTGAGWPLNGSIRSLRVTSVE